MKLKNMIFVFSVALMVLLCLGCVCASQDNASLSTADEDVQIAQDLNTPIIANESIEETGDANSSSIEPKTDANSTTQSNTSTNATTPTVSKKEINAFCTNAFIQKSNKYFTVKLFKYNEKTNKLSYYKNVKITVKVKIGSKTKTVNVKTDSKGSAKILNVKNLKVGSYKVTVASNDDRYTIKEKGTLAIFSKKQKTLTLKMNKRKKVKNDYIEAFYLTKNSMYPKGVYVDDYNAKKPLETPSHTFIVKTKFFFKNKKTGKVISKTVKSKTNKIYGWDYPSYKLIKGYTPIKAKIWYVRC